MSPILKITLNVIGSISVGLGVLGIFLPLLPTTPFLLLASACYLRGSDRLHHWLITNKYLGNYISNIESGRGIPLRGKVITIIVLWASLGISIWRLDGIVVHAVLILIGICTTTFLIRMKTLKPSTEEEPASQ